MNNFDQSAIVGETLPTPLNSEVVLDDTLTPHTETPTDATTASRENEAINMPSGPTVETVRAVQASVRAQTPQRRRGPRSKPHISHEATASRMTRRASENQLAKPLSQTAKTIGRTSIGDLQAKVQKMQQASSKPKRKKRK